MKDACSIKKKSGNQDFPEDFCCLATYMVEQGYVSVQVWMGEGAILMVKLDREPAHTHAHLGAKSPTNKTNQPPKSAGGNKTLYKEKYLQNLKINTLNSVVHNK